MIRLKCYLITLCSFLYFVMKVCLISPVLLSFLVHMASEVQIRQGSSKFTPCFAVERQKEVLWDALQMEFAGYKTKLEVITMDAGAEFEKMRNLLQALYDDTDGKMKELLRRIEEKYVGDYKKSYLPMKSTIPKVLADSYGFVFA